MPKVFNVVTVYGLESVPEEVEADSLDEIDLDQYRFTTFDTREEFFIGVRVYDENNNLVSSTIDDDEIYQEPADTEDTY